MKEIKNVKITLESYPGGFATTLYIDGKSTTIYNLTASQLVKISTMLDRAKSAVEAKLLERG